MPITAPPDRSGRAELAAIRSQIKAVIEAACGDADVRIHKEWKLKLDIGSIVSLLIPQTDPETEKVHSWMIGTGSILTQTTPSGSYEFVGGRRASREIVFTIWGFIDYTIYDNDASMPAQEILELEAELIADYFLANGNTMGFDVKPVGLSEVKPFQIENLDTHSFSEGFDLQIAQCTLRVVLAR